MQTQRTWLLFILVLVVAAMSLLLYPPLRDNQPPIQLGLDLRGGAQLTIQVQTTDEITEITKDDLDAVELVISNRVNGLGVSEAVVQTAGADRILVQLPGVSDPEEAEELLGETAQLDFRTEDPTVISQLDVRQREYGALIEEQISAEQKQDKEAIALVEEKIRQKQEEIAALEEQRFSRTDLTGENLRNANYGPANQAGTQWQVNLYFDSQGAEKFAELTKSVAGTGRTLGIFLDDELISAPSVGPEYADTGISGGRAQISGNFDATEAKTLSLQLQGGSLPLPVEIVENRTVGATLGQDSVRRSIYAGLSGLLLVLVFMVVYYRILGLIANLALGVYTILTLACFTLVSGFTLTLPGIAGFILSIGMAVDANVLIFERTREELRAGRTVYRAVESGFNRAFSSILDSNVTTLIACGALFWLGSGLVKGFALTLGIGVGVSMFTAYSCSRTILFLTVLGLPSVRQKPELFCPNLTASAKS